ncbi:hypothetical protein [Streptosporangium sp. NPDC020145]|uniref:hypothetical protein n=1 Tax=Streptosporangium sp. NPDC020145 TaxID=3154694 RepID=UPI0034366E11
MSDLFSTIFAVYVFIAALGGGSFLLASAVNPSANLHYFKHEIKDKFPPWVRYLIGLSMISLLWPIVVLVFSTERWWSPEKRRRRDS